MSTAPDAPLMLLGADGYGRDVLILAYRDALPGSPVVRVSQVLLTVLAAAGTPFAARGVRAIVAGERDREHVQAARAAGARMPRVWRHVLPHVRS